jgi:hypothetical protein
MGGFAFRKKGEMAGCRSARQSQYRRQSMTGTVGQLTDSRGEKTGRDAPDGLNNPTLHDFLQIRRTRGGPTAAPQPGIGRRIDGAN